MDYFTRLRLKATYGQWDATPEVQMYVTWKFWTDFYPKVLGTMGTVVLLVYFKCPQARYFHGWWFVSTVLGVAVVAFVTAYRFQYRWLMKGFRPIEKQYS